MKKGEKLIVNGQELKIVQTANAHNNQTIIYIEPDFKANKGYHGSIVIPDKEYYYLKNNGKLHDIKVKFQRPNEEEWLSFEYPAAKEKLANKAMDKKIDMTSKTKKLFKNKKKFKLRGTTDKYETIIYINGEPNKVIYTIEKSNKDKDLFFEYNNSKEPNLTLTKEQISFLEKGGIIDIDKPGEYPKVRYLITLNPELKYNKEKAEAEKLESIEKPGNLIDQFKPFVTDPISIKELFKGHFLQTETLDTNDNTFTTKYDKLKSISDIKYEENGQSVSYYMYCSNRMKPYIFTPDQMFVLWNGLPVYIGQYPAVERFALINS